MSELTGSPVTQLCFMPISIYGSISLLLGNFRKVHESTSMETYKYPRSSSLASQLVAKK